MSAARAAELEQLRAVFEARVASLEAEKEEAQAELLAAFNAVNADWSERLQGVRSETQRRERRLSVLLVKARSSDDLEDLTTEVNVV